MLILRSVVYNIYFYSLAALMVILWLPLLAFGSRKTTLRGFRLLARGELWGLRVICGTKLEVRGLEILPKDRPVIIASKHQSLWDIVVFFALIDDVVLVSKQEVGWIPVLGFYANKAGTIKVDRGAAAKALRKMIQDVGDALGKNRSVIIFPEGTRAAPGAKPSYKPGIVALYTRLDHACVPVALNSGVFWPRRQFVKRPGTIVLAFQPLIEPGLSRKDFMDTLETSIETASKRLLEETAEPATA